MRNKNNTLPSSWQTATRSRKLRESWVALSKSPRNSAHNRRNGRLRAAGLPLRGAVPGKRARSRVLPSACRLGDNRRLFLAGQSGGGSMPAGRDFSLGSDSGDAGRHCRRVRHIHGRAFGSFGCGMRLFHRPFPSTCSGMRPLLQECRFNRSVPAAPAGCPPFFSQDKTGPAPDGAPFAVRIRRFYRAGHGPFHDGIRQSGLLACLGLV